MDLIIDLKIQNWLLVIVDLIKGRVVHWKNLNGKMMFASWEILSLSNQKWLLEVNDGKLYLSKSWLVVDIFDLL